MFLCLTSRGSKTLWPAEGSHSLKVPGALCCFSRRWRTHLTLDINYLPESFWGSSHLCDPGMSWASHCEIPGRPLDLAPLSQWVTGPWAHTPAPGETWAQIPPPPSCFPPDLPRSLSSLVEAMPPPSPTGSFHMAVDTKGIYADISLEDPCSFFSHLVNRWLWEFTDKSFFMSYSSIWIQHNFPQWTSLRVIDRVSRIIHPVRLTTSWDEHVAVWLKWELWGLAVTWKHIKTPC